MDGLDQLDLVIPKLGAVVRGVRPEQLDDPVPGTEFTVRELLGHFLGNLEQVTASFSGTPINDLTPRPEILRDNPTAAFDRVFSDFGQAIRAPGVMEQPISLPQPFGDIPAEVFVRFLVFDLMIHAWELARATGQTFEPPGEIIEEVDAFARQAVAPAFRNGEIFADEVEVPEDTPAFDRLVAFSGRQP
jgi:uncharacterized protein (TIGR03086 family)